MTHAPPSAEARLSGLLERLLNAAEASLRAGELEGARSMAEEVRAVDPDNQRAARVLDNVASRQLAPLGERVLLTLLFSDLVGSTLLSEQVEPEQLRDVFSFYRAAARDAVERYSGYVMQYSGDGILAGFGYPQPHEDDARRAVLAGLDLVAAMEDARQDLDLRLGVAPQVRVGIHTGRVVVTDLSTDSSVRERDSIVGVAPNLAARIQAAAGPDQVVISDVTQQLVDAEFYLNSLGVRDLKGIGRPVEVFQVDAPRDAGARFEAERYRFAGLIGREEPRDRLFGAWHSLTTDATATTPMAFLVAGEAGIGKTRLVAELVQRIERSESHVLAMSCLPYYSNVSLWPVERLLARVVGGEEEGDRVGALVAHLTYLDMDLERTVPFLARLLSTESADYPAPELDPTAFLEVTLDLLVDWLTVLAERRRHLLIAEDLQWADPSTLGLLGRLVDRHPPGIMFVGTTRDESVVPWRAAVERIGLGRLTEPASLTLIDELAAGRQLSEDLRDSIIERAIGNPLYIEELTRSCLEESRAEPIPLRLQELFAWRLKSPGLDLRTIQVAATVGPAFRTDDVAAVVGDETLVGSQIEALLERGIIEATDTADVYRFRHTLMRDAAYETQVLDDRIRTHAGVAEAVTARGGEPALIAEHLDRAGQRDRAVTTYIVAAQQEQSHGAHIEANRLLTRALDLMEEMPESEERDLIELTGRMLRGLSVSSMRGYAAPEVQFDHRRAETLATRLGNRPEVLPSLIAIWAYWLTSGNLSAAEGLIERLTAMVEDPAYAWFEPEVEGCAGWVAFYRGEHAAAATHLTRAMDGFAGRGPDEKVSLFWPLPNDPIAVSAIALACVATVRGQLEEARRWEEEAIERAEGIGFPRGPFSLAFVKAYAAWMRRFLGDHEASRVLGGEVVAIGHSYGYAYWVMLGSSYLTAEDLTSDPDAAYLDQNIATLRLMGQEAFAASNLSYLAALRFDQGDVDGAHDLVQDALEIVHKAGEHIHLPELLRQRAVYSLARGGNAEEARADLIEALRVAHRQEASVVALRSAIEIARLPEDWRPPGWRGQLEEARAAVTASLREVVVADELLAG